MIRQFRLIVLVFMMAFLMSSLPVGAQDAESPTLIRFAHFALDAPNVDVFVDGEAVVEDAGPAAISDFMGIEPGTHSIAIAPTGEGEDAAVIGPEDVEVEEGHRYSVAVVGHAADSSLMPLVIDETAEIGDTDLSQGVFRILVNNIAGSPPISFYEQDMWVEQNIEPGTYSAELFPAFFWDTGKAVVGDDLDNIVFDFDPDVDGMGGFWEPYTVYLYGLMGTYPGAMFEDYTIDGGGHYVTAPDLSSFLAAFDGRGLTSDSETFYEFNTLVDALEATELDSTLAEGGPYTIFVPTDQAFGALPEGTLDTLMDDPDALRSVLLNHVVEGSLTYDDIVEAGTLTSLAGEELTITPSDDDGFTFRINDDAVVPNFDYPFLNSGNRVYFINNMVLVPPDSDA